MLKGTVNDTLRMLHLHRKNYCSVHKDSPSLRGMLQKSKDYITYGTITSEAYEKLKKAKGEKNPKKEGELKPFFRLHPPIGGFERKGIKTPYARGGALGDRKDKMPELITKMMGK